MQRIYYCTGGRDAGIPTIVQDRVGQLNGHGVRPGAEYVLYWAQMKSTYPCANGRLHVFVLEGVPDDDALEAAGSGYCFYLRKRRAGANDVLCTLRSP
jgi:hypothetical protein